jgi:hypothetical protein
MDVALTRRLLIERNMIRELSDVTPWEIKAVQATIALNTRLANNPWYTALRQPNQEKLLSHIATEKSFVASLRQMFMGSRRRKSARRVAVQLAEMWNGIRDAAPEAFKEPRKYLIQRTPGMFAFNFFLAPILLSKAPRVARHHLRRLSRMDAGFWKRSNKKGARQFGTGMSGYANLAAHIRGKLGL